jgi:hypothetical protein
VACKKEVEPKGMPKTLMSFGGQRKLEKGENQEGGLKGIKLNTCEAK